MARPGVYITLKNWIERPQSYKIDYNPGSLSMLGFCVTNMINDENSVHYLQKQYYSRVCLLAGCLGRSIWVGNGPFALWVLTEDTYSLELRNDWKFSYKVNAASLRFKGLWRVVITIENAGNIKIWAKKQAYFSSKVISNPGIVLDGSVEDIQRTLTYFLELRDLITKAW